MTNEASAAHAAGQSAAGQLSTWYHGMLVVLDGASTADVPCGTCTACCTSRQFIPVDPDEHAALAAIPAALLFPAPGSSTGQQVMGYDEQGCCPMFVDGVCSIYAARPRACRAYDCRVFAATGVTPDADKPRIAQQASRWSFGPATPDDTAVEQAIAAARSHLQRTQDAIDPALRPASASQAAVITLLLAHAFLVPAPSGAVAFNDLDDAQSAASLQAILASRISR